MKRCTVCKQQKQHTEFNKKSAAPDGLQPHCRECSHDRFKAYYHGNYQKHLNRVGKDKQERKLRNQVLEYLRTHPCVDCPGSDPVVLEFDHRGDKYKCISVMVNQGYTWKSILKEILKCDVRCANCHRRITYKRAGLKHKNPPSPNSMVPAF